MIVQTKFGERFKQLRELEYATLIKVAQFFNVSTDYLLGLKDYK